MRVDADQPPAADVERPAVGADKTVPAREPRCIDELMGVLAGRLVADVVIAGQGENVSAQALERGSGESEFVVAIWAVDGEIAIDDDCVDVCGIRKVARDNPVVPEEPMRRRQVDVGEQDEAGHAGLLAIFAITSKASGAPRQRC